MENKIFVGCRFSSPEENKKVRSEYAPWITDKIKQAMHWRDFLKKRG